MNPVAVLHYCERAGAGALAEPLNAFSNAAFFLAALLALRALRRSPVRGWDLPLAIGLLVTVGVGSSLWHTLATGWAQLCDSVPIMLLVVVLFASVLRRIFGLSRPAVAAALGGLLVACVAVSLFAGSALEGSLVYAPAWLVLVLMAVVAAVRGSPFSPALGGAAALLSVSLILRTIDRTLCPVFPLGTHFMWHLLNAALLYALLRTLIAAPRSA